jgi:hypothetical protein
MVESDVGSAFAKARGGVALDDKLAGEARLPDARPRSGPPVDRCWESYSLTAAFAFFYLLLADLSSCSR